MIDKVMVLFGPSGEARRYGALSDSTRFTRYVLSGRSASCIENGPAIHCRQVSSYSTVPRRPWTGVAYLNADYHLCWLRESPAVLEKAFFPLQSTQIHLWTLIRTSDVENSYLPFVDLARSLGIRVERIPYPRSSRRSGGAVLALCCDRPEQFVRVFHPSTLSLLLDSTHIAVNSEDGAMHALATDLCLDACIDAVRQGDIGEVLAEACTAMPTWLYTIRIDPTYSDSPDIAYLVPASSADCLVDGLEDAALESGYELHHLPLLDALVSNWIGFGEISVEG